MEPEFLGTGLWTGIVQNEDMGLLKDIREGPAFSNVSLRRSGVGSGLTKYN